MTAPHRRMLVVAPSAELYGSDRTLLASLPELCAAYDVTVAVPATGPFCDLATAMGAHVVVLPDYALRRRNLRPAGLAPWLARATVAVRRLHRLHHQLRFELVYSNTLAAGIGVVLTRLWRIPHLLHVHERSQEAWLGRLLLRTAAGATDVMVCNSHYTKRWVVGLQPSLAGRAEVVHNGIDLPEPSERPQPQPPSAFTVVLVGRIHPKKGHLTLVEAAALAVRDGRRWDLHFHGDALPEHESLRGRLVDRVAASGVRAQWHGFTDDTQAMYAGSDVAVVPSVVPEEFSLVCVEAQSMELPVVATGPGGASEVIVDQETGLIVPAGDVEALYAALRWLEDDPALRRRMGVAGRERMTANFSREIYAARIVEICGRLGERKARV